jgi:hypothetical protein
MDNLEEIYAAGCAAGSHSTGLQAVFQAGQASVAQPIAVPQQEEVTIPVTSDT